MPRDQQRRQKAVERKAAKRKEHLRSLVRRVTSALPWSGRSLLRLAPEWPVHECWISRSWQTAGALVQAVVARRSPAGQLAAAVFLIDLGCLGVKNAFARPLESPAEYDELLQRIGEHDKLTKTNLDLVAKVVEEAIAYAKKLGFAPHPDYREAAPFLAGAQPERAPAMVPLGGKDGKPFFVAGPHDNVKRIMAQLRRTVGEGNFDFIVPLGPPSDLF